MFAWIAVLCAAIAALIAFTSLSGISVIGLIALSLLFGFLHLALGQSAIVPWRTRPPGA